MPYDLIIKNGKVIDGSGLPGFHGDVAVSGGRIVEIGRVSSEARRVADAGSQGRAWIHCKNYQAMRFGFFAESEPASTLV